MYGEFLLVRSMYDHVSAINIICIWRLADDVFCTFPGSLLFLFLVLTDTPGYLNILMQCISDGRDGCFINTGGPPYPRIQHPPFTAARKNWKIKEMVHKFQNAYQARTGLNIVESSSPNAPST